MKEKHKKIRIGKKTFVVIIAGGIDNEYWHIIPAFSVTCDKCYKKTRIAFAFIQFWCGVWIGKALAEN